MDNSPPVAIMMPVYNGEDTLPLAIKSLLAQTYTHWKCYIVNDGSTDGTKAYLKGLKDTRFEVCHLSENRGRRYARQKALDLAEGDYLAFLDAGDFYHPEKLKEQIDAFQKYPEITVCSTGVGSFDDKYTLRTYRGMGDNKPHQVSHLLYYPGLPASTLIEMKVAKQCHYHPKMEIGEDNYFLSQCLQNRSYLKLDKILYYYDEIGAVSYKKFLNYQVENLRTLSIRFRGLLRIKLILKDTLKLIVKAVGALFLGVNFFIVRRGKRVANQQVSDYREVLSVINQ